MSLVHGIRTFRGNRSLVLCLGKQSKMRGITHALSAQTEDEGRVESRRWRHGGGCDLAGRRERLFAGIQRRGARAKEVEGQCLRH